MLRDGCTARTSAGACSIGLHQRRQEFVARLLGPAIGVGDEEALILGEPLDQTRVALFRQRGLQRVVGDLQPAHVGDVLADRQLAIDEDARENLDLVVLRDDLDP